MENTDLVVIQQNQLDVFSNKETFDQMTRAAVMLSKTNIIPTAYKGKPEDCFVALEMANRMGVSPMFIMQNLYIVQGKPSFSGQAATAMIKNSPKYREVKHVYTGQPKTDSWGCYVSAIRISDGEEIHGAEVTIGIAKSEGWYGKQGSKWQTMPEIMLAYRASAWFARVHEPGLLMGMQTTEEVTDVYEKPQKQTAPNPLETNGTVENNGTVEP